ncbi:hypothetical protein NDU88_007783 [Pleurodeles waltl]|uniref:Uncharacterized protein n=1 Tax=Pleurodeles waltl TaxID=8319 RepID=A0AAV7VUT4_PLEWA|nr:hypothetical protein NDU88_007783 [Pleurodeles waltl]
MSAPGSKAPRSTGEESRSPPTDGERTFPCPAPTAQEQTLLRPPRELHPAVPASERCEASGRLKRYTTPNNRTNCPAPIPDCQLRSSPPGTLSPAPRPHRRRLSLRLGRGSLFLSRCANTSSAAAILGKDLRHIESGRQLCPAVKAATLDEGAANAPTPYLASERVTVGAIFPQGHNRRQ